MATPINETPVSVDYTSRDYYSLRDALVTRVKTRLPAWSGDNPADFGVALIEAFAYMGDVVNYYIDRVANESYLPTATQRRSVINLARTYGYSPTGFRASETTLQLTNSSETEVVLPAGTQFSAQVIAGEISFEVVFSIEEEVTVPAQVGEVAGTAEVTAYQYEQVADRPENQAVAPDISGELVAVSTGQPEQVYRLLENQIVEGSVEVWVQNGVVFEQWQQVPHLIDYGPNDPVFSVVSDANEFVYITFGDGVSGTIPFLSSVIKARYKVGGGSSGNLSTNLVDEIRYVPGITSESELATLASTLEVTNITPGVGGQAPEDNASIKRNASRALTALNRAVTLNDYAALALQVPGVGKSRAVADIWTSVTLYIAPQRNLDSVDQFPGYSGNPEEGGVLLAEWDTIQEATQEFLSNKLQVGVTVTVSPPTYTPASVDIFYKKLPQYTEQAIETAITQAVIEGFSYFNVDFAEVIHPEAIEALIRQIPGVVNANVTGLYRTGSTAERKILIADPDELFVFLSDNVSVAALSSEAKLSALTTSVGTLAPSFVSAFNNYSLSIPDATASVNFTATTVSASATLTINGVTTSSGSAATILTPVGVTEVSILVTAADGTTTEEYTVSVTRNN